MPLHFLSDEDVAVLQRLLGTEQNRIVNSPTRLGTESSWSDKEDHQATQTYVAKPITGGIPARTTSTEPGKALCDLYRITLDSAGDPTLEQMDSQQKLVYNLSSSAIDRDFLPIIKAKSGHWVALVGGSGENCNRFRGTVLTDDGSGLYTVTIDKRAGGCDTIPEEAAGVVAEVEIGFTCLTVEVAMEVWCEYVRDQYSVDVWEIVDACCPTA